MLENRGRDGRFGRNKFDYGPVKEDWRLNRSVSGKRTELSEEENARRCCCGGESNRISEEFDDRSRLRNRETI